MSMGRDRTILVTGATGYVGGRLVKALERRGERVRCLARKPEILEGRTGLKTVVVQGDVLAPSSLPAALEGVHTAYYLIHSLGARAGFESKEEHGAKNFAAAARGAGVCRIIYLGGFGAADETLLSPHLRSRCRVGQILAGSGIQTIEFRASIILGAGSLSFELIRALVARLPVMIAPRWVSVMAQPIAISDVLDYLVAALDLRVVGSRIYEIGGADRMSYGDIMCTYARMCGLRRFILKVPVLTPRLSSLWLGLVTPLHARVGRKLIDSMTTPSVVQDDAALRDFDVRPVTVHEAIEQALHGTEEDFSSIWQ